MSAVIASIAEADALLPGVAPPYGAQDPRWQAIIKVANFIPDNPAEVWAFIAMWGRHPDRDLKAAIATCALEHLLEQHFQAYFPKAAALARADREFARTVCMCWASGQAEQPLNAAALQALIEEIGHAI